MAAAEGMARSEFVGRTLKIGGGSCPLRTPMVSIGEGSTHSSLPTPQYVARSQAGMPSPAAGPEKM